MALLKCFKLMLVLVVSLVGLAGVALVFHGGLNTYRVGLSQATTDGVADILSDFIACEDYATALAPNKTAGHGIGVHEIMLARCAYEHSSSMVLVAFAGLFSLLAVVSGMLSNCRDVKGNMYTYTVISGVAMSLLVVGIVWMNSVTAFAATKLLPCIGLSANDVLKLKAIDPQIVCWDDGQTQLKAAAGWFTTVASFYVGAGLVLASLMVFLLLNACAQPTNSGPRRQDEPLLY